MSIWRKRRCWWCYTPLSASGHAEIPDQLGNTVLVHKSCAENATKEIRKLTAQPPNEEAPDARTE